MCADAHVCVCTCVWKSEIDAQSLPPSISLIYNEAGSLSLYTELANLLELTHFMLGLTQDHISM